MGWMEDGPEGGNRQMIQQKCDLAEKGNEQIDRGLVWSGPGHGWLSLPFDSVSDGLSRLVQLPDVSAPSLPAIGPTGSGRSERIALYHGTSTINVGTDG